MNKHSEETGLFKRKEINVFFILVLSIFISETLIMVILRFLPTYSTWGEALLDSSILSALIFPVIYLYLIKPLKVSIAERNAKENQYSELIQNMGEGVIICDEFEKFIFANTAAEKLFGAHKGELIGVGLENYFSEKNFQYIVQQTFERKKGITSFYETEILLKDGTLKDVFITASPQFKDGYFSGTLAIFRDISALKKAEESIKYERNLLRALIDNLPDAVYVKDKSFKKIIANPVDLAYMGLHTEDEILGKDDYDIYPKDIADSSFADDRFVFETGKSYLNKEDYFIDNQGKEHWMLNSKVPIHDANGEIIGLVGIGREITERKKELIQLQLMESVITHATDAVVITKTDEADMFRHKIIFVNNAYSKMTGYSLEEVIGKPPSILQGPNTDKEEIARVRECLSRYEPCHMEVINYKKNGEEFWTSIAFSPISDNNGKYTHWIAIKRDITDHKKLEQNFINAKEVAEAASKAKSEFLANMSHEIRTPLNSVIGFSDLLAKTRLDATQKQYNSIVFQSANSLLDIINEILDFSKIEAGKLEIDIIKTDILDLCYKASDVICYQAYKKNLELLLNIGQDVPRFLWIDAVRIRQILINLMGNAVKFTSQGEIELKVAVIKNEDELSTIRFSVRDTGIGIHQENIQKIFEAFSQEDASTNRKYGGTGLGLAISKKLLGLMGSELQVKSELGKGSTFLFDLSVRSQFGEPNEWVNNNQYKDVLIVDDNANNRLLLKEMLSLQKIESTEAANGSIAIEKLRKHSYDLILMDYNMPGIDGIDTIRQIREDLKLDKEQLPIILLHSSAEDERVNAACQKYSVSQRLVKPIKITQLYELMSNARSEINHSASTEIPVNPSQQGIPTGKIKVLVVDDNEFNIMLIKKIVCDILPDATILEAVNGKEALEQYRSELPNIIFMDVQMPEMNGKEATKIIRSMEKDKHIPIIALSAGTQIEEMEKSLEAGMDDFVSKPFVHSAIVDVIKKWL